MNMILRGKPVQGRPRSLDTKSGAFEASCIEYYYYPGKKGEKKAEVSPSLQQSPNLKYQPSFQHQPLKLLLAMECLINVM